MESLPAIVALSRKTESIRASLGLPFRRAVISYPKSGRTWLRVMLDELGVGARYTHAGAGHNARRPISELTVDHKFKRGVLLLRDPRDTVVSGFHQATKRILRCDGAISDFIRDPCHGIEKCARFNLMWHERARSANNMLITSYEALHRDAVGELRRITDFFGQRQSQARIEETVQRNSFEHMQRREGDGSYLRYGNILKPGNPRDINSYKVRRGKIGGYRDELSASDIDYCDSLLERLGYFEQVTEQPPSNGTASRSPQNS